MTTRLLPWGLPESAGELLRNFVNGAGLVSLASPAVTKTPPITVRASTPNDAAKTSMATTRISGLPVVNRSSPAGRFSHPAPVRTAALRSEPSIRYHCNAKGESRAKPEQFVGFRDIC